MTLAIRRPATWASLFYVFALFVAGCASSASERANEAEPDATAAGPSMYVAGNGGVSLMSASGETSRIVRPGETFGGLYVPAANGRDVVLTLETSSSLRLALLSAGGSFRTIHEGGRKTSYTVAWSSNGNLAFGFEGSRGRGIRTVGSDGSVKDVGCSASSHALGWASPEKLVVGDANNYYVVGVNGCTTIRRVDARKMHEMAFNPMHPTVPYIRRELDYDRKARQYVPDSSLYLAGVDGSNPSLIAGDRYKPRRPSWSPDGLELAFDARIPDQPHRRLISVYDAERGSSAFLNPSAVGGLSSEWDAHWSPGGSRVAYMQRSGDDAGFVVVRSMHDSFVTVVSESGERFARWIDDSHLVVTDGTRDRVVSTDGKTSVEGPEGAAILWVR